MHPELFEIPFIHLTIKSFALMMVIAFLLAVSLIRRLSRSITPDPHLITNAALYSLIGGVVGARLFYVFHYFDHFQGKLLSVFSIWQGGLEFYGGVILAIAVVFFYLCYHKFYVRRYEVHIRSYFDILAIGVMLALVPGRIGCFLNGCCQGKPTELPWAVRFPYNSFAYVRQVNAHDEKIDGPNRQLNLPREYFSYVDEKGVWYPKPYEDLTEEQKAQVTKGEYRCLPVHPTQLYSSAAAGLLCLVLYLFWRRSQNAANSKGRSRLFAKPGCTFSLMFILYGISRFFMEFIRDDNPLEYGWWAIYKGATVSQNLAIYTTIFGMVLMVIFQKMKPKALKS
ncbi:Phosphatidylglycerol--prolipoprotein diacylglyceryl transferase [subsurface metagenome]